MYRCYHSELKIQYASKSISPELLKTVARSTKQRWKKKTTNSFWTPYPIETKANTETIILQLKAENQYLKKKIKALFYLVQVYRKLFQSFQFKVNHAQHIRQNMQQLTNFCDHTNFKKIIWRYLPFSAKQWKAWNTQPVCKASLQSLCRKTYTHQLAIREQDNIKVICQNADYQNWPLCSIYFHLMRQNIIYCGISTFYKYCRLLNITRKRNKYTKHYIPIRAKNVYKILHQDITVFRTTNGVKHYIYVIRDNFSRAILACKAATEYKSEIAKQTLEEVLVRYNLLQEEGILITDDGAENKGKMDDWLQKPGNLWKKMVAQLDIIQSNSMVEAANKILKYRFLYKHPVADSFALNKLLIEARQNFNNMPNAQLAGYTPDEVLNGAIPDHQRFKEKIKSSKILRRKTNKLVDCKMLCKT